MTYKYRQSGATLITALVMLVALTLLVVSGIRSSNTNLRIAGNMQMQEEAVIAAQHGIEQTIGKDFTTAIATATIAVDIDHNGTTDYTAQIAAPTCTSSVALTRSDLDEFSSADDDCTTTSQSTRAAIVGSAGPIGEAESMCLKQSWDIRSTVADSKANAVVRQGVYMRVAIGTVCP